MNGGRKEKLKGQWIPDEVRYEMRSGLYRQEVRLRSVEINFAETMNRENKILTSSR